ncbi:MAG: serine hydrolase [Eudoraea sp.]|nr:serine hydrolase [Eudoraea sp.]
MTRKSFYFVLLLTISLMVACSSNNDESNEDLMADDPLAEIYFPPLSSSTWEIITPEELGWNTNVTPELNSLLEENGTKAFIILKNGRIAMETYFGSFTRDSIWYWASAGKTLTAFTIGIAQENNLLSIDDPSSQYLGEGWTSAEITQENAITVRNQLTMTSGLNDLFFDCVSPECLRYTADAGSRWAYHNGPYTLLQSVVGAAAGTTFTSYFNSELRDRIGMNGFWLSTNGSNNVYFSNARSMARFGLLNLNLGTWGNAVLLSDMDYVPSMSNTSQELNRS